MDNLVEPFWVLTNRKSSEFANDVEVCLALLVHTPSQFE